MTRPTEPRPSFDPDIETAVLKRLARTLVADDSTADDIVQEVWLVALEEPPSHYENGRAWLRAVARNVARQEHRRRSGRRQREQRAARIEALPAVGDALEARSVRRELARVVGDLEEPFGSAVRLRYFEELPVSEVAARLDRPLETVKSQLKRGLSRLRQRLDREYGDRLAWSIGFLGAFDWEVDELPAATAAATAAGAAGFAWLGPSFVVALLLATIGLLGWTPFGRTSSGDEPPTLDEVSQAGPEAREAAPPSEPSRSPEAAPVPTPDATTQRFLDVLVLDSEGRVVEGAAVLLGANETEGERARTDAEGRASVELADGDFLERIFRAGGTRYANVLARADGWAQSDRHFIGCEPGERASVTLRLPARGLTVSGRVVDEDGAPIEGAVVRWGLPLIMRNVLPDGGLTASPIREATTDGDGVFVLGHVPCAREDVCVTRDGYAFVVQTVDGRDRDRIELDLVLSRGATITGTVRDASGGPVEGARVELIANRAVAGSERSRAVTDGAGHYELTGVRDGFPDVRATGPTGDFARRVGPNVISGQTVEVDLVLRDDPGCRLLLVDSAGRPFVAAKVLFRSTSGRWTDEAWPDEHGRVSMHGCPDERIRGMVIPLNVRQYFPLTWTEWDRPSREERTVVCELDLDGLAEVTGVVLDAEGRAFHAGLLRVVRQGLRVVHDFPLDSADGAFRIHGAPPGRYELYVSTDRAGRHPIDILDLERGQRLDLGAVRLPALGTVNIDWKWPAGDGMGHRLTQRLMVESGQWQNVTLSEGEGIPPSAVQVVPGTYALGAGRAGSWTRIRFVRVRSGGSHRLQSGPDAPIWVGLEFREAAGPVEGATLAFALFRVTSDEDLPADATTSELLVFVEGHGERLEEATLARGDDGAFRHETALGQGLYVVVGLSDKGPEGHTTFEIVEQSMGTYLPVELR